MQPAARILLACIALLGACKRVESNAGPPTAERLAKACIRYTACAPLGLTVSGCIRNSAFVESQVSVYRPSQVRCLAETAGDCSSVAACLGISLATCAEPGTRCDGDTAIVCDGGIEYSFDCSEAPESVDGTCVRDRCGYEPCSTLGELRCTGTRVERCDFDGVRTGVDCMLYGEVCVWEAGIARCEPARPFPCSETRCDGDSLIECDFTGHRIDCASLYSGGKCLSRALRCGYGDHCSAEVPAFCVGTFVEMCVLGEEMTFDCLQLGFSGCSNGACVP